MHDINLSKSEIVFSGGIPWERANQLAAFLGVNRVEHFYANVETLSFLQMLGGPGVQYLEFW